LFSSDRVAQFRGPDPIEWTDAHNVSLALQLDDLDSGKHAEWRLWSVTFVPGTEPYEGDDPPAYQESADSLVR